MHVVLQHNQKALDVDHSLPSSWHAIDERVDGNWGIFILSSPTPQMFRRYCWHGRPLDVAPSSTTTAQWCWERELVKPIEIIERAPVVPGHDMYWSMHRTIDLLVYRIYFSPDISVSPERFREQQCCKILATQVPSFVFLFWCFRWW